MFGSDVATRDRAAIVRSARAVAARSFMDGCAGMVATICAVHILPRDCAAERSAAFR